VKNIVDEAINNERACLKYWKDLMEVARVNRCCPTLAEKKIWDEVLRKRKLVMSF